jgi:chromosome segregation ATPase
MQSEGDSPNLEAQPPVHPQWKPQLASRHPQFGDFVPNDQKIKRNGQSRGKEPTLRGQPKEKNVAIDNVRSKLEQSETDLKASRKALEEANATIKSQKKIIDGLKSDAALLQDQNKAESETTKSMGETASKMKEDNQKLKDKLMTATADIEELEAEKKVVESTREKDKAQHLKALEDLRSNHQAEKKALEDGRSEQQATATEQIKKLEAEKKVAESGRLAARTRYNETAAKLQNLQAEKYEIERESSKLRDQVFWLETARDSVKEELEKSNSRSQHFADKNSKLEAKKTELETTVELLEQSKSAADETIAKQAKELTERETEVKRLNKAIHSVRREKEALASLEAKRKIMFPIRIVLALLFLLLAISLCKWYYG